LFYHLLQHRDIHQQGTLEGMIVIALADSKTIPYGISAIKRAQTASTLYSIGWLTVWFWGIGIIFWIIGWWYKNKS